jgi:hypothetical protein
METKVFFGEECIARVLFGLSCFVWFSNPLSFLLLFSSKSL